MSIERIFGSVASIKPLSNSSETVSLVDTKKESKIDDPDKIDLEAKPVMTEKIESTNDGKEESHKEEKIFEPDVDDDLEESDEDSNELKKSLSSKEDALNFMRRKDIPTYGRRQFKRDK